MRRLKKERQMKEEENEAEEEEVEVVAVKRPKEEDLELGGPLSFSSRTAKEIEPLKKEEEEEENEEDENGEMEIGDESGTEEKDKELLR